MQAGGHTCACDDLPNTGELATSGHQWVGGLTSTGMQLHPVSAAGQWPFTVGEALAHSVGVEVAELVIHVFRGPAPIGDPRGVHARPQLLAEDMLEFKAVQLVWAIPGASEHTICQCCEGSLGGQQHSTAQHSS